jgi:hypothetical protein
MARIWRHRRAIGGALLALAALGVTPALALALGSSAEADLYDRPVLAVDPGMHTAAIWSLAVDAQGGSRSRVGPMPPLESGRRQTASCCGRSGFRSGPSR